MAVIISESCIPKLIISFKEALGDSSQVKTKDLCAIAEEV